MDFFTLFLIAGFVGGLSFALLLRRVNRRTTGSAVPGGEPILTDAINMSRIRVAGIGGLGFVAMAIAVAFVIPSIGWSLAIGLVLGLALASVLIVIRGWVGPMASSSAQPGANTTLSIDTSNPDGHR
jgi:hypothetical protein